MDALLAYLPEDRARALARGEHLPDQAHGAALFADISGFTPLTELVTRVLGPRRGVEALTDQINTVYAALTAAVTARRGSVISFGGDAITCWFDDTDGPGAQRAAVCALDLQATMTPFSTVTLPGGFSTALALKVAIATGSARRFVVGDPEIQQIDALAGAILSRVADGEHLARPAEVLLDEATAAALGPAAVLGEPRVNPETSERFTPLYTLASSPSAVPWAPVELPAEVLRPWVLPVVWERHLAGLGAFLTELRPAVVLFLHFGGLDFDGDDAAGPQLDALVRSAQAILADTGGTLLQLTLGDKGAHLYAAFGAPVAHEDDADRAARAALALQAMVVKLGLPPAQIGLSQGTLRCGAYGGQIRRTYGVLGDDVNLAARLMSRAAPGETLLSPRVQQALGHNFAIEARPPLPLKGKAEPLPVFTLAGLVRRRAIRLQEPTYALPIVGRERELIAVEASLKRALGGQGQVVVVEAEAGMGKSRLLSEVVRIARRRGCICYGGAAAASGTQTPYLAWRPVFQALLDIDPDAPPRRSLRQLAGELEDRVPARAEAMPLLDLLLELPLPENAFTQMLAPPDRKNAREALLTDLLIHAAREAGESGGALLLVLEDTHWLDPLSHDLLLRVAHETAALPVLLLLAIRPAAHGQLPSGLPHAATVALEGLGEAALEALVRAKLGQLFPARTEAIPAGLVAALAGRAQGNPFYVEELLSYLRDRGVVPDDPRALASLDLPDSLHRLVLARIDQLSERERATLRVASVVGRLFHAFWLPGFVPNLGDLPRVRADLNRLAQLDLTSLDTPEPELIYLFKHVVTQEVAYASLPLSTRTQLHGALARWLEAQSPLAPPLDVLAYHYDRSDNLLKRREYLRRAGLAAAAQHANAAALDYLGRAIALAPAEDVEERWALLSAREAVHSLLRQRDSQAADLAALAALAVDHRGRGSDVALREAHYHIAGNSLALYATAVERALTLAACDPDREFTARLEWGRVLALQSNYTAALAQIEQALAWARASGNRQVELSALIAFGAAFAFFLFDPGASRGYCTQALALSHELGDLRSEAAICNTLGAVAIDLGNYAEARHFFVRGLALFQRIGDRFGEAWTQLDVSHLRLLVGDYSTARAELEQKLELFQRSGERGGEASVLYSLGECAYQQGALVSAEGYFAHSLALVRAIGDRRRELPRLLSLGYVQTARGNIDAALAMFEEYGVLAETLKLEGEQRLMGRAGLAHALLTRGDIAGAHEAIKPALRELPEGSLSGGDERLRAYYDMYLVLRAAGDRQAAPLLAQLHACLVRRADVLDERTRQTFLNYVPINRVIMRAWEEQEAAG